MILTVEGSKLGTDSLQFAYKPNSGTASCTWMVTTVVDIFTRNGKTVFGAAMDMSKAFDMVKWSELFRTLMDRNINPLILRLLLHIYRNQQYTVRWGNVSAEFFSISNGVRQGGVCSGILFAVYIDQLLTLLRESGFGCYIHGVFYGAVIYADDIFLLSASRTGLQNMVDVCQKFTKKLNLKFGTDTNPKKSKTKCLAFSKSKRGPKILKEIILDGNSLPWVSQVNHLGHILQTDNSMKIDINMKRSAFIGKVNSILQEFHYANSEVLMKLVSAFTCNMYGSNTWDLFSPECHKLYRSYNVALRLIFGLPRTTHKFLLESVTGNLHLNVQLLSRYVTFTKSLLQSNSFPVRFLARVCCSDMRTVLGKTIGKIARLVGKPSTIEDLSVADVKKKVKYVDLPASEEWRLGLIFEMRKIMDNEIPNCYLKLSEAVEIFEYACVS